MKALHIALVIGAITIICLSSGIAAASIGQSDLTTLTSWSKTELPEGNSVIVTITVQSNSAEQLQIYYFGVHFDWMAADTFAGQNLQSDPVTIPSGGSYQFTPSIINIPEGTSLGSHSYFIGIDGEDSYGDPFSWNSPDATIQVVASSASSTPGGNTDGGGDSGSDWTLGIIVIAVTAVVMVVIILFMLRRKRSASAPAQVTEPAATQPEPPKAPEETPKPEQEFDI